MPGDETFPVHRQHALDRLLRFERIEVDHAAAGDRAHREEVHHEDDLLLRQPHDDRAVGVVEADMAELERRSAEAQGALFLERLVGQHHQRILLGEDPILGAPVGDDRRAGILERLAAGDVVVVVVAVDQVLDRLVGDLLDLLDVGLDHFRPAVADRIGGDHAGLGHHEHRLVVAGAEDVDVVGAFDLGGGIRRLLRKDGQRGKHAARRGDQLTHGVPPALGFSS